jgi:hypothetical protein
MHSTSHSTRRKSRSSSQPQTSPTSKPHRGGSNATKKTAEPVTILSDSDNDDAENSVTRPLPVRMPGTQTIKIDSDDEAFPVQKVKSPPPADDDVQSEEEFPELVARAKEKARQKAILQQSANKSFGEKNHTTDGLDDVFDMGYSMPENDPTISILIDSPMEGTKPLIVHRKLSQRLKEVRLSWCDRQVLALDNPGLNLRESVFLTWRGKKLFDATTCTALGLKLDRQGNLSFDGGRICDEGGNVHLVAWTQEALEIWEKREAARERRENGEEPDEFEKQPKVKKIRLVLKGKGMEDFKLMAKPTSTAANLLQALRDRRNISTQVGMVLVFDGDKLEDSQTVEDLGLDDMDVIEVH